jgi:hypothetical protein
MRGVDRDGRPLALGDLCVGCHSATSIPALQNRQLVAATKDNHLKTRKKYPSDEYISLHSWTSNEVKKKLNKNQAGENTAGKGQDPREINLVRGRDWKLQSPSSPASRLVKYPKAVSNPGSPPPHHHPQTDPDSSALRPRSACTPLKRVGAVWRKGDPRRTP